MKIYLGKKKHDGTVVSIPGDVRRKHMAIFGKSGTGKSTLMRNMIVADLDGRNGLTLIDPHGALVEELLECIPRHRTNDVIYLNPAHPDRVIGMNVLQSVGRHQRSLVVSSIISILRNLYPANWGPRTEWILEHVVYALLEQEQPVTLASIATFCGLFRKPLFPLRGDLVMPDIRRVPYTSLSAEGDDVWFSTSNPN